MADQSGSSQGSNMVGALASLLKQVRFFGGDDVEEGLASTDSTGSYQQYQASNNSRLHHSSQASLACDSSSLCQDIPRQSHGHHHQDDDIVTPSSQFSCGASSYSSGYTDSLLLSSSTCDDSSLLQYGTSVNSIGYSDLRIPVSESIPSYQFDEDYEDKVDDDIDNIGQDNNLYSRSSGRRSRSSKKSAKTLPEINLDQVAQHDMMHDCWIVLYDKVYDVTQFLYEHPGGEDLILEHAGRDATIAFRGVGHSKAAVMSLKQYIVGVLPPSERIFTEWELQ